MAHNMSRWVVRIGQLDIIPASATADILAEIPALTDPATDAGHLPELRRRLARRKPGERKSFLATDTVRRRYLAIPARLASSARKLTVHLPARWPWAEEFYSMLEALRGVQAVT